MKSVRSGLSGSAPDEETITPRDAAAERRGVVVHLVVGQRVIPRLHRAEVLEPLRLIGREVDLLAAPADAVGQDDGRLAVAADRRDRLEVGGADADDAVRLRRREGQVAQGLCFSHVSSPPTRCP
jgi:hypothetical protein